MPALASPPDGLVGADGAARFGMFDAPLPEVDLDRAAVAGWPGALGRLRLKQWQHFCVVGPEIALTFAVVDAAFMQLAWVQLIDRASGAAIEIAGRSPMLRGAVARSLWDDRTRARGQGLDVQIHSHLAGGAHRIAISAERGGRSISAELECPHDLTAISPLVVSLPVGRGRAMYSHKVPLPARGHVTADGQRYELTERDSFAILDIHKAHYPRRTWWNWATFAGWDDRGRLVGVNLTRNVVADADYHENGLWIDGRLRLLGSARFSLPASGEGWTMGSADGAVDLRFTADGERREDLNYGVVVSKFQQKYGRFTGRIAADGEEIAVREWFGLAEDHSAVW